MATTNWPTPEDINQLDDTPIADFTWQLAPFRLLYGPVYASNATCGTADPAAYDAAAQAAADTDCNEFYANATSTLSAIHTYASRCPNYTLVVDTINNVHFSALVSFGRLNEHWHFDQSDPQRRDALVQQAAALAATGNDYMGTLGAVVRSLVGDVCEPCVRLFWKLCRTVSYMARAVYGLIGDALARCESPEAWPGREMGATWDAIADMLLTSVEHFNATVPAVSCDA